MLELVRRGDSNREIATALGIGEDTVKAHLSRLYARFAVPNRAALVAVTATQADVPSAVPAATTLGGMRAMAADAHRVSLRVDGGAAAADPRVIALREALAAVDLALDLVSELPEGTIGAVVGAVRKRLDAAFAALDELSAEAGSSAAS